MKGLQICLVDVIPNNSLTVFNVIWDVDDLTKDYAKKLAMEGKLEGELEKLQNRLVKVFFFLNYEKRLMFMKEERIYCRKNVQNPWLEICSRYQIFPV